MSLKNINNIELTIMSRNINIVDDLFYEFMDFLLETNIEFKNVLTEVDKFNGFYYIHFKCFLDLKKNRYKKIRLLSKILTTNWISTILVKGDDEFVCNLNDSKYSYYQEDIQKYLVLKIIKSYNRKGRK